MSSAKLQRTATALYLFHLNRNVLYGMVDGWPITLTKNTLSVTVNADPAVKKDLAASQSRVRKVTIEGTVLTVQFKPMRSQFYPDAIHSVLAAMTADPRIEPVEACPLCGKTDCDSAAIINRVYCRTHASCIESMNAEEKKSRKGFFTGLLGMFLGMLVGTLPRILTYYLTWVRHPDSYGVSYPLYYTYMGTLVLIAGLLSYGGYKLLHGRMGKNAYMLTLLIMLLFSVFVAEFEAYTITVLVEYEYPVGACFYVFGTLLTMPDVWKDIASENIPVLIWAVICSLVLYRIVTQNYDFDETDGSIARSSISRLPKGE